MRLIRSLVVMVIASCFAGGCATMSQKEEIQLGEQVHGQFEEQFGGKVEDPELQQYVNRVGMEMAHYAGRPDLNWQFAVLKSDEINAFAVPGGYVYITQGLLNRLNNEAQLAGVLGHEAGHIAHRHSVKQIQRAQGAQVAAAGAGILGAIFGVEGVGDIASVVANLSLMKYGRDQEKQADLSGLKYMSEAGYNPKGMVQTMQILEEASSGNEPPEFLSTHPNPENRIEYLQETIDEKYPRAAENGQFDAEQFRKIVEPLPPPGASAIPIDARSTTAWRESELLNDGATDDDRAFDSAPLPHACPTSMRTYFSSVQLHDLRYCWIEPLNFWALKKSWSSRARSL